MKGTCAPGQDKSKETCYSRKALQTIAQSYNRSKGENVQIVPENSDNQTIFETLKKELNFRCKDEKCWAMQDFIEADDRRVLMQSFRPPAPRTWVDKPRTWLTNFDIQAVMSQYMASDPSFDFLGVVPIDFAVKLGEDKCLVDNICNLDISNMVTRSITKLACVVNLDPHDKPGSHWVSFVILLKDKKRQGVYYYDSVARSPPKLINSFLTMVVEKLRESGHGFVYRHNTVRRQYENSECGCFCIHFIDRMITSKKPFDQVCEEIPYDPNILELRKKYFDYT